MSSITYTIDLGIAGERDVTVEFDYTPATRGYYSGPPEDCFPAEAEEISVNSVQIGNLDLTSLLKVPLEESGCFIDAVRDEMTFEQEDYEE